MKITSGHHRSALALELDPPFRAAWDPLPRTRFEATLVRVHTDEGLVGVASGDTMDGFAPYESLFVGADPLRIARHVRALETVEFHAGRCWPLEAALWDIAGQALGVPCATLFGGAVDRLPAYASLGELRSPAGARRAGAGAARAGLPCAEAARGPRPPRRGRRVRGGRARGRRRHDGDPRRPQPVVADAGRRRSRARAAGGAARRRAARRARACCGSRSRCPAPTSPGMRTLREQTGVQIAGGEMARTFDELLAAHEHDALDVFQPDVVLALGMSRARTLAELLLHRNRRFTPHTWTNGLGLLANLHVVCGVGGGPFVEYPFDPPGWTAERRDFMLAEPIGIDADGCLRGPAAPRPRRGARRGRDRPGDGMTAVTATWHAAADALRPRAEAFIDGAFVPAASGATFADTSPRDGRLLADVARGGAEDVDRAVASGRAAFEAGVWSQARTARAQDGPAAPRRSDGGAPRGARAARVRRRRQADRRRAAGRRPQRRRLPALVRRGDRQALRRDRADRPRRARAGRARAARRDRRGRAVELPADHHRVEARRPRWRPATAWCSSPPSSRRCRRSRSPSWPPRRACPTACSTWCRASGPRRARRSGRHPGVDKIAFTGSVEVGRRFQVYAGESNGKQVSLELGGKSPQVVLADAPDLDAAASAIAWGIFYNAGQTCHAGSRLVVERSVREELVERVVAGRRRPRARRSARPRREGRRADRRGAAGARARAHRARARRGRVGGLRRRARPSRARRHLRGADRARRRRPDGGAGARGGLRPGARRAGGRRRRGRGAPRQRDRVRPRGLGLDPRRGDRRAGRAARCAPARSGSTPTTPATSRPRSAA